MKTDNYGISQFKVCPKRYEFRIVMNIVPAKFHASAEFGIALHEGLNAWYTTKDLATCLAAFQESWREQDTGKYTTMVGMDILTRYTNEDNVEPHHVEVGIAVEIGKHILTGRVDLVGSVAGQLFVIDHKSSARAGSSFIMSPNYQMLGYYYGIKETLGVDAPIMVNLIKLPKYQLTRLIHEPTAQELKDYKKDFMYWCRKVEECGEDGYFPRVGIEYGVCAYCDYNFCCEREVEIPSFIESGILKIVPWKPF